MPFVAELHRKLSIEALSQGRIFIPGPAGGPSAWKTDGERRVRKVWPNQELPYVQHSSCDLNAPLNAALGGPDH